MTLERVTIVATLALAVVAQATVIWLLVSGWSAMDIFVKATVVFGRFLLHFLTDMSALVRVGLRLLSAISAQACDFFCHNVPRNATGVTCKPEYHPNLECFVLGTLLAASVAIVACPLGIWLFFYGMYRSERNGKRKTE